MPTWTDDWVWELAHSEVGAQVTNVGREPPEILGRMDIWGKQRDGQPGFLYHDPQWFPKISVIRN
jgi:hypothetical protein